MEERESERERKQSIEQGGDRKVVKWKKRRAEDINGGKMGRSEKDKKNKQECLNVWMYTQQDNSIQYYYC